MKNTSAGRRKFLRDATSAVVGIAGVSVLPTQFVKAAGHAPLRVYDKPRIRFSVIGINHGHINALVEAVKRGGG